MNDDLADYNYIKEKAEEIESLYSENKLNINRDSELQILINNAKDLCDDWLAGRKDKMTTQKVFNNGRILRISEAVLSLKDNKECKKHLKSLLKGNLYLSNHIQSKAKDKLFEVQVYSMMKKSNCNVELEEPDIVFTDDRVKTGIACKNIYSEKHVQNVLSKGVKQIKKATKHGVLAINIEHLLPEDFILKGINMDAVIKRLRYFTVAFSQKHSRHFMKYLAEDRIAGAMVLVSCILDVSGYPLTNMTQSTFWCVPKPSKENEVRINALKKVFVSN